MASQAERIAVAYLEKEVKSLRANVARLEKKLAVQAKESSMGLDDANGLTRTLKKSARDYRKLKDEVGELREREAVVRQRDELHRLAQNTGPAAVLEEAVSRSGNLLPTTSERIRNMFSPPTSLVGAIQKLIGAYDDALRAARSGHQLSSRSKPRDGRDRQ